MRSLLRPLIPSVVLSCIALVSVTLSTTVVRAQDDSDTNFRYGLWLHGGYDLHDAQFSKFTDVGFCCPSAFGSQSGFGASLGGLLRFNPADLLNKRLIFDIRLGVMYSAASFTTTETTLFNDPTSGGNETVEGTFDYIIDPTMMSAVIDVMPTLRVVGGLAVHAGVRAGYIFMNSYDQIERISPQFADRGFIFTDTRTDERNVASGEIPGINALQWSGIVGLSWEFPLNSAGTTLIAPEVFYVHGFTDVSSAVSNADGSTGSWSRSSINAGISLRFSSVPTVKPDPCDTIINGVIQSKPCPEGEVLVFNAETNDCHCKDTTTVVDSIIVRIDDVRSTDVIGSTGENAVTIESFKVRHWRPVLPWIFFDLGNTQLDLYDRYIDITPEQRMVFEDAPSFKEDWHRHTLNIIGKRLFQAPNDTVRLLGYYVGAEGETVTRALDRAYAVRDYLYRRWSIGFDRMSVESGGEREIPVGASLDEGRVVEIRASSPAILAPIEMPGQEVVVHPTYVVISATIDPGMGRTVASITYELRLGGGSGRRPKPLTATFNAGDPGFDEALKGWRAAVGTPDSRIYQAVVNQLDADDLILIPSLSVTFSNGQKTEAEKDVRRATLRMPSVTPEQKRAKGAADTAVLVLDVLFTVPGSAEISAEAEAYVAKVMDDIPRGASGVLELLPADAASRTFDSGLFEKRREAVRSLFQRYGIRLIDGPHMDRDDLKTDSAKGAAYSRAVRAVLRSPLR